MTDLRSVSRRRAPGGPPSSSRTSKDRSRSSPFRRRSSNSRRSSRTTGRCSSRDRVESDDGRFRAERRRGLPCSTTLREKKAESVQISLDAAEVDDDLVARLRPGGRGSTEARCLVYLEIVRSGDFRLVARVEPTLRSRALAPALRRPGERPWDRGECGTGRGPALEGALLLRCSPSPSLRSEYVEAREASFHVGVGDRRAPDKIADQISDAVLDAILAQRPGGRVACETLVTTGLCIVAGEITTQRLRRHPAASPAATIESKSATRDALLRSRRRDAARCCRRSTSSRPTSRWASTPAAPATRG